MFQECRLEIEEGGRKHKKNNNLIFHTFNILSLPMLKINRVFNFRHIIQAIYIFISRFFLDQKTFLTSTNHDAITTTPIILLIPHALIADIIQRCIIKINSKWIIT